MSQTTSGCQRKEKWYKKRFFPLIPIIELRKADEYNTSSFSFRWLIFTFWSLNGFQFELSFNIDTHWGIGFTFLLPYLRGVIAIPCPEKLGFWVDRNLSRRVKHQNECKILRQKKMKYSIMKGDVFLCIEDYVMDNDDIAYVKGKTYVSEEDGSITDERGDKQHKMDREYDFFDYFQYSPKSKKK